jgi:hypothetical protein
MPLRSITAYNGWLILEHSEMVEGKLSPRFSVQHPPNGPIQAGNSFNEAKRAIDGHPKSRIEPLRGAAEGARSNGENPGR